MAPAAWLFAGKGHGSPGRCGVAVRSRHCRPSRASTPAPPTEQCMSRIITVFGATGAQGGGLARAILSDPARRFRLRAVTRKPSSPAALALAAAGAEIVATDLDDPASVRRAIESAHGAFYVTNFWEHFS